MTHPQPAPPRNAPEPDFLVSVVLADDADGPSYRDALQALVGKLEHSFQFWEVVVAVPEANADETLSLNDALHGLPNLRILRLSAGNFYQRRLAGATEAIGDVVILSALDEISAIDVPRLATDVYGQKEVLTLVAPRRGWRATSLFARVLGSLSGYRIDENNTYTIGFPRSILENVLLRPDAEILLRFNPVSGMLKFKHIPAPPSIADLPHRRRRNWWRRVSLAGDMIVSASPRILRAISFVAFLTACIAMAYAVYAVVTWLFTPTVVEGWLTTSLLQSLTTFLLGISISAISLGLVRLIDVVSNEARYAIVDEVNTIDLVGNIKAANVDVSSGGPVPATTESGQK